MCIIQRLYCRVMNNITSHSEIAHPILRIPIANPGPKVTSMLWGTLDKSIITGHENGELIQWDLRVSIIVTYSYHSFYVYLMFHI
jgi:hypothetical protein